jgi:hypothetical protein
MTQRSTIRGETLSITGSGNVGATLSAGALSVPTKFDVDGDGNVDAVGIVTAFGFAGPGLSVIQRWRRTYDQFTDPGQTITLDLGELSPSRDAVVLGAFLNVRELFDTGGPPAPTSVLMTFGRTGDTSAYVAVLDARTELGWHGLLPAERGGDLGAGEMAILPAGDEPTVSLGVTGAPNLDDLATGIVDLYLNYAILTPP